MVHTQTHGEQNEKCANILTELGNAFSRMEEHFRATQHYEHATLIHEKMLQTKLQPPKQRELSRRLDLVYVKLLQAYILSG